MGRDWLRHFRLDWAQLHGINRVQSHKLDEMLAEHPNLFKPGLGKIDGLSAKLYVKPGAQPKFCRARQVPFAICEKVEQEIDRQVEEGILEPVKFSEWATPVVPIIKKDGSVRLCGDYKVTVNQATEIDTYPLPRIEDMLVSLAGGTAFSKLDLAHAYQQVVLCDESKELVTINTHKGLYRVNRLPFGVASAPSMFQRIMESILHGLPGVSVYIDDILITGKSIEKHLENLEAVLTRLEETGLRLKRDKCAFLLPTVEYLWVQDHGTRSPTNTGQGQSSAKCSRTTRCVTVKVVYWSSQLLRQISTRFIQCSCSPLQVIPEGNEVGLGR